MEKEILEQDTEQKLEDDMGNMTQEEKLNDSEGDKKVSLKDILADNEELYKEYQSTIDTRITRALEKREKKYKEELARQQKLSSMTQEELVEERERELQEREKQLAQYEMKLKKIEYFKENNIPLDLVDYVIVDKADELEEKTGVLMGLIEELAQTKVKEQLKSNGINISPNKDEIEPITIDDMAGMSVDEINAYFDNLA